MLKDWSWVPRTYIWQLITIHNSRSAGTCTPTHRAHMHVHTHTELKNMFSKKKEGTAHNISKLSNLETFMPQLSSYHSVSFTE